MTTFVVRLNFQLMATLSYNLSKKADKATGFHEILARFVLGSRINQRAKTNIFAPAEYWNKDTQLMTIPAKRLMDDETRKLLENLNSINTRLQGLRAVVMESFMKAGAGKKAIEADWLKTTIDKYNFPEKYETRPEIVLLSKAFDDYINGGKISSQRQKMAEVVQRSLLRYEAYTGKRLDLATLSADDIKAFESYLRQECRIVEKHPELLQICPETRKIEARSENTINDRLKILRAVVLKAVHAGQTNNNPFINYTISDCIYGTPYYITIAERNHLYNFDLSSRPAIEVQRDIFIFQCVIGCRVSDLMKLTRKNLINGAIEYIPQKTREENPTTVRVPLNSIASAILEKYKDDDRKALLPFVSAQKYNDDIKEAFALAGLTRPVTVLDPQTRQEVQRPLNLIASSHLARRTFVGNLYKQVKDPNLIAKLSGHVEGSRAFARYRDIDEDIRKDLVKMLE